MGAGDFIHNPLPFDAPHSKSIYTPDYIINPHPRFAALTRNIRTRRGEKVNIKVPLYRDVNTPEFRRIESASSGDSSTHSEEQRGVTSAGYPEEADGDIHMDCMAFGMGMCCLVSECQTRTQVQL